MARPRERYCAGVLRRPSAIQLRAARGKSLKQTIERLNPVQQGWIAYFRLGESRWTTEPKRLIRVRGSHPSAESADGWGTRPTARAIDGPLASWRIEAKGARLSPAGWRLLVDVQKRYKCGPGGPHDSRPGGQRYILLHGRRRLVDD